jgi:hypothetical protein
VQRVGGLVQKLEHSNSKSIYKGWALEADEEWEARAKTTVTEKRGVNCVRLL